MQDVEAKDKSASRLDRRDRFLAAVAEAPVVMGILNVTPDSFSDGGNFDAADAALTHARRMVGEGCAIVDIGGESTRPGASFVPADEEWARVAPALAAICGSLDIPVSIDTYKAEVARRAAQAGAAVINDVWGLQRDPGMARTVAETQSAVVIMHNREDADPALDIMDDMRRFFHHSLALAEAAGVPRGHILLDPGIGFGKTQEQNQDCLHRLDTLGDYGLPVLLGLSRKSIIGHVLKNPIQDRLTGTLAANVIGLMRGARVLRVHDVGPHVEAIKIHRALGGRA